MISRPADRSNIKYYTCNARQSFVRFLLVVVWNVPAYLVDLFETFTNANAMIAVLDDGRLIILMVHHGESVEV